MKEGPRGLSLQGHQHGCSVTETKPTGRASETRVRDQERLQGSSPRTLPPRQRFGQFLLMELEEPAGLLLQPSKPFPQVPRAARPTQRAAQPSPSNSCFGLVYPVSGGVRRNRPDFTVHSRTTSFQLQSDGE